MLDVKQVIAKRKCEKMSGRLTFGREIMSLVYVMHREFEKRSKQCEKRYISPTNAKIIAFLAENRGRDVCQLRFQGAEKHGGKGDYNARKGQRRRTAEKNCADGQRKEHDKKH